jgi:hypothetical protein
VRGIVPSKHANSAAAICGIFSSAMEPVEAKSVFYSGTQLTGKLPALDSISTNFPGDIR